MVVFVVLVVAMIAFATGAILVSRRIRLTEYTSYRSRGSFASILFSLLASLIGGWMFFGLSAVGYEAGILGYVIGAGYAVGLLIIGYLVPRIKRAMASANADTMDDFVGSRYGKVAQTATSVINLSFFVAVLAAQFIAMAAFLSLFVNIEVNVLFFVAVVVVLLYTSLTGFKGVLFTDVWQFWIVSVSVLAVFLVLSLSADWGTLRSLEPKYFNATGYGVSFLVGVLVFFPFSLIVRTDLWQRVACAKRGQDVQRAFYVCSPLLLLFYIVMTTIGIYARARLGEGVQPEQSGMLLFLNTVGYLGTGKPSVWATPFVAFFSLGVFAALLSTIDTNLNVIAVAISKLTRRGDWLRFEQETADKVSGSRTPLEHSLLRTARVLSVAVGVLGLIVAWAAPNIVNLMVGAASMLLVFIPSLLATLLWKTRKVLAATVSIIVGYVTFLLVFVLVDPKVAFLPGAIVSFVSYSIVRFFPMKLSSESEKR